MDNPRSNSVQARSISFNRLLNLPARSSAVTPPKILAILANLKWFPLWDASTITGVNAASPCPWTISFSPLAGCSIPCARVTPAVLMTIPPIVDASVIFSHASLPPSPLYTLTRFPAISSIAYKLRASVNGCAIFDVYASMQ